MGEAGFWTARGSAFFRTFLLGTCVPYGHVRSLYAGLCQGYRIKLIANYSPLLDMVRALDLDPYLYWHHSRRMRKIRTIDFLIRVYSRFFLQKARAVKIFH